MGALKKKQTGMTIIVQDENKIAIESLKNTIA